MAEDTQAPEDARAVIDALVFERLPHEGAAGIRYVIPELPGTILTIFLTRDYFPRWPPGSFEDTFICRWELATSDHELGGSYSAAGEALLDETLSPASVCRAGHSHPEVLLEVVTLLAQRGWRLLLLELAPFVELEKDSYLLRVAGRLAAEHGEFSAGLRNARHMRARALADNSTSMLTQADLHLEFLQERVSWYDTALEALLDHPLPAGEDRELIWGLLPSWEGPRAELLEVVEALRPDKSPAAHETQPAASSSETPLSAPTSAASEPACDEAVPAAARAQQGFLLTLVDSEEHGGFPPLVLNAALYLQSHLGASGKTVCVIDTNFSQPNTYKFTQRGGPLDLDVLTALTHPGSLCAERLGEYVVRAQQGFSILAGSSERVRPHLSLLDARLYSQVIPALRELYDYVLIQVSAPGFAPTPLSELATSQADSVVVLVGASRASAEGARRWLDATTSLREGCSSLDPSKVLVALDRNAGFIDIHPDDARAVLGEWCIAEVIPESAEVRRQTGTITLLPLHRDRALYPALGRVLRAATADPDLPEEHRAPSAPPTSGLLARLRARRGTAAPAEPLLRSALTQRQRQGE